MIAYLCCKILRYIMKELIEKYFDGNIADAEIKELSDWIKNDRHL